jgi:hypothetical protein
VETRRCVIQLFHPGGEPDVPRDGVVPWNAGGKHKRKFLRLGGSFLEDLEREPRQAELGFWGEWEPQSRATPVASRIHGGPAFIHEPFFDPPASGLWMQNTDPYVFAGEFIYSNCQQHRYDRPAQLANLAPGSLVLFGSGIGRRFLLDTVVVVGERFVDCMRSGREAADAQITDAFREITVDRVLAGGIADQLRFRIYFGATRSDPLNGMFSFAPCQTISEAPGGFPRPSIELPGYVTPTNTRGYKRTFVTMEQASSAWRDVVAQVLQAELKLGVNLDLPPRAEGSLDTRVPELAIAGC